MALRLAAGLVSRRPAADDDSCSLAFAFGLLRRFALAFAAAAAHVPTTSPCASCAGSAFTETRIVTLALWQSVTLFGVLVLPGCVLGLGRLRRAAREAGAAEDGERHERTERHDDPYDPTSPDCVASHCPLSSELSAPYRTLPALSGRQITLSRGRRRRRRRARARAGRAPRTRPSAAGAPPRPSRTRARARRPHASGSSRVARRRCARPLSRRPAATSASPRSRQGSAAHGVRRRTSRALCRGAHSVAAVERRVRTRRRVGGEAHVDADRDEDRGGGDDGAPDEGAGPRRRGLPAETEEHDREQERAERSRPGAPSPSRAPRGRAARRRRRAPPGPAAEAATARAPASGTRRTARSAARPSGPSSASVSR